MINWPLNCMCIMSLSLLLNLYRIWYCLVEKINISIDFISVNIFHEYYTNKFYKIVSCCLALLTPTCFFRAEWIIILLDYLFIVIVDLTSLLCIQAANESFLKNFLLRICIQTKMWCRIHRSMSSWFEVAQILLALFVINFVCGSVNPLQTSSRGCWFYCKLETFVFT